MIVSREAIIVLFCVTVVKYLLLTLDAEKWPLNVDIFPIKYNYCIALKNAAFLKKISIQIFKYVNLNIKLMVQIFNCH